MFKLNKKVSLFDKVEHLKESRKSKIAFFATLKEGLECDNEELFYTEEEVRNQIDSFESLLNNLQSTRESNEKTISEIERIVG